MRSIKLTTLRADLSRALDTLSVTRRRRFTSTLPIWLHFDLASSTLHIVEERATVAAEIAVSGEWPPVGATVDLFMLKRAVKACRGEVVELHALSDAVMLQSDAWHVRLKLLKFGPESGAPVRPRDEAPELPLFSWAGLKN